MIRIWLYAQILLPAAFYIYFVWVNVFFSSFLAFHSLFWFWKIYNQKKKKKLKQEKKHIYSKWNLNIWKDDM